MATWENELKKAIVRAKGSFGTIRQQLTSSNIKTTATSLATAATGRIKIVDIILSTDATGLAGGTNFQIVNSSNTYGATIVIADAVSGLGANVTHSAANVTSAGQPSATDNVPYVLEGGDILQYKSTVAACTGAGLLNVTIIYQRVDENADLVSTGA